MLEREAKEPVIDCKLPPDTFYVSSIAQLPDGRFLTSIRHRDYGVPDLLCIWSLDGAQYLPVKVDFPNIDEVVVAPGGMFLLRDQVQVNVYHAAQLPTSSADASSQVIAPAYSFAIHPRISDKQIASITMVKSFLSAAGEMKFIVAGQLFTHHPLSINPQIADFAVVYGRDGAIKQTMRLSRHQPELDPSLSMLDSSRMRDFFFLQGSLPQKKVVIVKSARWYGRDVRWCVDGLLPDKCIENAFAIYRQKNEMPLACSILGNGLMLMVTQDWKIECSDTVFSKPQNALRSTHYLGFNFFSDSPSTQILASLNTGQVIVSYGNQMKIITIPEIVKQNREVVGKSIFFEINEITSSKSPPSTFPSSLVQIITQYAIGHNGSTLFFRTPLSTSSPGQGGVGASSLRRGKGSTTG